MAEIQAGGLYRVGDKLVNAEGKEAEQEEQPEQEKEGTPEAYPYAGILADGGYGTWEAVQNASDEELLGLDGIGKARLREIRAFEG